MHQQLSDTVHKEKPKSQRRNRFYQRHRSSSAHLPRRPRQQHQVMEKMRI